jgi:uncharacterized membrane protein
MVGLAVAALGVALYLGITKLQGGTPMCGEFEGCDTVNSSEYAEVFGIPTGLLGAAASLVTAGGAFVWWLAADRRGLLVAYLVGLVSLPFLAWLTYLELFVIHAICLWCVAYAVLVIAGWSAATYVLAQGRSEAA